MNTTFIALISKKDAVSLSYYRPISLCNAIYKDISKLIASKIKNTLFINISLAQLGFLDGRKINDVIVIVQECIHTMKIGKIKASLLKFDLHKAFDNIDLEFLRMILQGGYVSS